MLYVNLDMNLLTKPYPWN